MDHIELSSAEVEKTLNDTACCVLILDIALSDKNIPKFTIMAMKDSVGIFRKAVCKMSHVADNIQQKFDLAHVFHSFTFLRFQTAPQ